MCAIGEYVQPPDSHLVRILYCPCDLEPGSWGPSLLALLFDAANNAPWSMVYTQGRITSTSRLRHKLTRRLYMDRFGAFLFFCRNNIQRLTILRIKVCGKYYVLAGASIRHDCA